MESATARRTTRRWFPVTSAAVRLKKLAKANNANLSMEYHLDKNEWHVTLVGAFGLRPIAKRHLIDCVEALERRQEDQL